MDFIKRHYEKVILLGLFVIFIGLMFLVKSVVDETREVTDEHLALDSRPPDHQPKDPESPEFKTQERWENSRLEWAANSPREQEKGMAVCSDFVSAFPMAVCPHCSGKNGDDYRMLVPFDNFSVAAEGGVVKKGYCPQCGTELLPPKERRSSEDNITAEDMDGDGITNDEEQKYGMNPQDPNDACYDLDGDGFSNIFEIKNGFAPNDSTKHPPLWWRLRIKDIRTVELPVKFMTLNDNASSDKTMWQLQFNQFDKRRDRIVSHWRRIGQTIKIEDREYTIDDVERRVEQRTRQGGALTGGEDSSSTENVDLSRVYLTEKVRGDDTPDKLTMIIRQPAYSNDKRPVLVDSGDISEPIKEHVLQIGGIIKLGMFDGNIGTAVAGGRESRGFQCSYRLKEVDLEKKILYFEDITLLGRRGSDRDVEIPIIEISQESKVPEDMLPKKPEAYNGMMMPYGGAGGMVPPPPPPPPLPPQRRR